MLTTEQAVMLMERVDVVFSELIDAGIPPAFVASEMMARGWASTFMCDTDTARSQVTEFYLAVARAADAATRELAIAQAASQAANSNESTKH